MKATRTIMAAWMLVVFVSSVTLADGPDHEHGSGVLGSLHDRDTLTNNWLGLGEKLEDRGISVALSLTQVYQSNLKGGMSTITSVKGLRITPCFLIALQILAPIRCCWAKVRLVCGSATSSMPAISPL